MSEDHLKYCARFLGRYGRIEGIQEDWKYEMENYNEDPSQKGVFDYFAKFLGRYGRIETILDDWEYSMKM